MLTVGSLFAGIGGFDLGLERAGMCSVWQCEIDPYAIRVLEKHWPDVLRVRDIRDVTAETVPWVDVICGGFPCQDISYAGLGAGLAGERSGLWSEMLRVIRELRPRYVVVENVAALLARGLDVVLGGLAAIGYDAEWSCIRASDVGAPHRRDRVWIVAYPNGEGEHDGAVDAEVGGAPEPVADASRDLRAGATPAGTEWERGSARDVGHANITGLEGRRGHDERPDERAPRAPSARTGAVADADGESLGRLAIAWPKRDHWLVEPDVGRVAHGIPARMDRLRSLGNALVPQIAEELGQRILAYEHAG